MEVGEAGGSAGDLQHPDDPGGHHPHRDQGRHSPQGQHTNLGNGINNGTNNGINNGLNGRQLIGGDNGVYPEDRINKGGGGDEEEDDDDRPPPQLLPQQPRIGQHILPFGIQRNQPELRIYLRTDNKYCLQLHIVVL